MINPLEWLEDCSKYYPNVSIGIEWISPECARRMLDSNTENRPLHDSTIGRAIAKNYWCLNGESIAFSIDRLLRDGQHRLTEISKGDKTVASIVVRGVSRGSQLTMDFRTMRTLRRNVAQLGYPHATEVASIAQAIYAAENGAVKRMVNGDPMRLYTVSEVVDFIKENYEDRIKPIVNDVRKLHKRLPSCGADMIGYLFDCVRCGDIADRDAFILQIMGESEMSNPVKQLVDKMDSDAKKTTNNLTRKQAFALLIKAWNMYMRGDDEGVLLFKAGGANPEALPVPITSSEF